jgi:hypothetical protein
LVEALHQGEWRDTDIAVKARYRLYVAGSTWARVPFAFGGGAVVQTTTVDGAPAAYDQGDLLIKDAGWHVIETEYQVPKAANGREASWQVPAATAALISLRTTGQAPVINGGVPAVVTKEDQGSTVTAALGGSRDVRLVLDGPARTPVVERPRLAKVESVLLVSPGLRTLTSEIAWEFAGSSRQSFVVDFDAAFALVRLSIPNLESWRLIRGGEARTRLEFTLTAPTTGALAISMTAEASAAVPGGSENFPRVHPEASRLEEILVLGKAGRVEVETSLATASQRIPLPDRFREQPGGERFIEAFRGSGDDKAVSFAVRQVAERDSVQADCLYQLEATGVNLFCRGQLKLGSARKPFRIGLPPGAVVNEFVLGSEGSGWWRSGDDLWLQAGGAEGMAFVLSVAVPASGLKTKTGGLLLPELGWPENADAKGTVLLATHSSSETQLTFANAGSVQTIEPSQALPGFSVLPPYQRSHAFAYRMPGFGAELTSREVTPVFDADWVLSAVVNETWIQLTFHLDVEVKRAALRKLLVKVAAAVPELRWQGEALREARSTIEGSERVYTLTFQEDVTEVTGLVASTELPLVQGGARLPNLMVADARQQTQFAVVENRTRGGLESNLARVEEVPRETLSYLPRKMNNPKFYRLTGPDWFLGVGLTKVESLGGMDMVITGSEIVTAIRENGEEWYQVSYRMRNQSLQFLPVKLSKEMEIIKVRAAGREVPAKRGPETRKTETILIPLEPTRNEDLSFLVELIYRRPAGEGTALGQHFRRALQAPELELDGRTEAQTFWRLYLPAGYSAEKVGGLVYQIPSQQRAYAIAEGNLEELEWLARSARTGSRPEVAWRNVLGLAALTREECLPTLRGYEKSPQSTPVWDARLRRLEEEAKAFRPGAELSVTGAAPGAELASSAASGFAENRTAVVERNRKLREAARARMEAVRDQMKLNDFIAAPWTGEPAVQPVSEVRTVEPMDEFAAAQTDTALRLLESWRGPEPKSAGGSGVPRFSLEPSLEPMPAVAPAAWVESVEQPRSLPEPDVESVRTRLSPGIDFPTNGEALLFYKVKGNAALEIAGERDSGRNSAAIWGWFLGVMGVIYLLARFTSPRRVAVPE